MVFKNGTQHFASKNIIEKLSDRWRSSRFLSEKRPQDAILIFGRHFYFCCQKDFLKLKLNNTFLIFLCFLYLVVSALKFNKSVNMI
jgi:hypothetical protein